MVKLMGMGEEEFGMWAFEMVLATMMVVERLMGLFRKRKMFFWWMDEVQEVKLTRNRSREAVVVRRVRGRERGLVGYISRKNGLTDRWTRR